MKTWKQAFIEVTKLLTIPTILLIIIGGTVGLSAHGYKWLAMIFLFVSIFFAILVEIKYSDNLF